MAEQKKKKRTLRTTETAGNIDALEGLRKSGLRQTIPRKAILVALSNNHGPFTADEVHRLITKEICDLATVYRALTQLAEVSLLRRCDFGDGIARFEIAESDHHHHHIVCKLCKRVEIIEGEEIENIDRFARKRGFSDVSHILEFFGTCPRCQ